MKALVITASAEKLVYIIQRFLVLHAYASLIAVFWSESSRVLTRKTLAAASLPVSALVMFEGRLIGGAARPFTCRPIEF